MRKFQIFLTAILIIVMTLGSIYAEELHISPDIYIDDVNHDFTYENYKIIQDGLKTKDEYYGKNRLFANEKIILSMTKYYQNGGSSWDSIIMQPCGHTIAVSGCVVTSFAMVASHLGSNDNPGQVYNKVPLQEGCNFPYYVAANKYNLTVEGFVSNDDGVTGDYAKTFILGALRNNRPVIVGFKKGGSTHFVAAYGYEEITYYPEGGSVKSLNPTAGEIIVPNYYIYDPWKGRDYNELDDYLNDGWKVHRLIAYGK